MIELAAPARGGSCAWRRSARRRRRVTALSITRRGMRRRWVAATLAAQPDPPYLVDFMDLLADRALPVRGAKVPA